MDSVIVFAIGLMAVLYIGMKVYKSLTHSGGCGCGDSKSGASSCGGNCGCHQKSDHE